MSDANAYSGREQTKAKHFILKSYLQALAFKILNFSDLTYVDGFSGPWETRTEDFTDSSFMIAIQVLKDAQQQFTQRGIRRTIRCFFCERDQETFEKLRAAVAPHNDPQSGFEIETHCGNFTDAIPKIVKFIGTSFALTFIDPTGWTGYDFGLIKPLLRPRLAEVIINYMYDFINRAAAMVDSATVASFDPILGGPGWSDRLDPTLVLENRGMAVEKLFREELRTVGSFDYVVSTKIYRPTVDRPHFFLTYGTKDSKGLSTFRETEYRALKRQAADRSVARERKREEESGSSDMFAGMDIAVQRARVDDFVESQKMAARDFLLKLVARGSKTFEEVWEAILQRFVLRETNVKDMCVTLSREGKIANTWGRGNRKPKNSDPIRLT